jgi:hypothetical protein
LGRGRLAAALAHELGSRREIGPPPLGGAHLFGHAPRQRLPSGIRQARAFRPHVRRFRLTIDAKAMFGKQGIEIGSAEAGLCVRCPALGITPAIAAPRDMRCQDSEQDEQTRRKSPRNS